MTAAEAAAFLQRAASLLSAKEPGDERLEYLVRNCGILREYMVRLIDEDVKCRGPLRRALKEGDERTIEAARQPAPPHVNSPWAPCAAAATTLWT